MSSHVKTFAELTPADFSFAGGKGMALAKMLQDGYPIPDGFVILSTATGSKNLDDEVWMEVVTHVNNIRNRYPKAKFAVRSSALSEDSSEASFAGEFETVLNQTTDEEIKEAIQTVIHSVDHERVKAYTSMKGMEENHQIAVVIQVMVPSEISGVLFTANPVTGSNLNMTGNFVYGLGEQLVSGEADAYTFELTRIGGKYKGPDTMRKYASELYDMAVRLEKEYGLPQDLEWGVANERLYLLQARPITTLSKGNMETYEINYSLSGDYLWTNANVGEAVPDVVTPYTWSILQYLDEEISVVPGYYLMSGNICGRIYTNISRRLSVLSTFGIKPKFALNFIGDIFGKIPKEMEIPIHPFTRLDLLKMMYPKIKHYLKEVRIASKSITKQIIDTPEWCENIKKRITLATTTAELKNIWEHELLPYHRKAWLTLLSGGTKAVLAMRLQKKLTKMAGEEDANALLSKLRGEGELASLGPLMGISKILLGQMSKEEYALQYGHRGPYEFELSIADPAENKDWLEEQITDFQKSNINVKELLEKQETKRKAAYDRFVQKHPFKKRWLKEQLQLAGEGAQLRESVRSEFIRVHRVLRTFMLRVGKVTGLGEDIFFLYSSEIEKVLSGEENVVEFIPKRKEAFTKFKSLPPFPAIIRGRFDPFTWSKDPKRRLDIYDPTISFTDVSLEELKGFAGASGRIEGNVRVLTNPDQGKELQAGEILVASSTNVGWTPLFPKAAAIITDVGAPLSHAAIVARELGIPAVVGCGNATTRLKTGDRVIVDGGRGIVQIVTE